MHMSEKKRPATVIRPEIRPGRRVIAISDIHGNLAFLKGLLAKLCFSGEDSLILVGDLFEKGRDSLAVMRWLMELKQRHTVFPLCGNCDHIDRVFLEGAPGIDEALWPVFRFWGERSLILQLGRELGIAPKSAAELDSLRRAIVKHFPAEVVFLLQMPHILEAGNFIFVHGGIPREDRLEELPAYECMKNDDFLGQGLSFRKWVVVGHWPVTLYRTEIQSAQPILDHRRHIASIDGGCVLKVDGQLNALIIPDIFGQEMSCASYDGLPIAVAREDQCASEAAFNIRWSDSAIEILREEEDLCWCRHISSGREMWILKEYISRRPSDGQLHCEDATDYRLPVTAGDRLAVVRRCSRGYLAKKDGVTGWYFGAADFCDPPFKK